MLSGISDPTRELLFAQLHGSHIRHVFVVDDEIDGMIGERE